VHALGELHDTSLSTEPGLGVAGSVRWIDQLLPFHRSSDEPDPMIAKHALREGQETLSFRLVVSAWLVTAQLIPCWNGVAMAVDEEVLASIASKCVELVSENFNRALNWELESLSELDAVCSELIADGPLSNDRFDLWWKLVGAYTGDVLIRAYDGRWVEHELANGAYGVLIQGFTVFPLGYARRVLRGETKSLALLGHFMAAEIAKSKEAG
jgi:hypothetical protein